MIREYVNYYELRKDEFVILWKLIQYCKKELAKKEEGLPYDQWVNQEGAEISITQPSRIIKTLPVAVMKKRNSQVIASNYLKTIVGELKSLGLKYNGQAVFVPNCHRAVGLLTFTCNIDQRIKSLLKNNKFRLVERRRLRSGKVDFQYTEG